MSSGSGAAPTNEHSEEKIIEASKSIIKNAQTRSVDQLQRLFAIIMGLALSEALRRTFPATTPQHPAVTLPNSWAYAWVLISLFISAAPFYHGNHRYLDDTYGLGARKPKNDRFLMWDFAAIFVEALVFFVAALYVSEATKFFLILTVLFFIDSLWVLSMTRTSELTALGKRIYRDGKDFHHWGKVNFIIAVILALVLFIFNLSDLVDAKWLPFSMCSIVVIRSVLDYALSWNFYYPRIPTDQ